MPALSAGLLLYRLRKDTPQVLLVHPGGPYFKNKDDGAWTIPKGEVEPEEDFLSAAQREFREETGIVPSGPFIPLTPIRQKSGKMVHAWACEGDIDPTAIVSNTFPLEWPPKSGKHVPFPEIDRAEFFDLETARRKIIPAQLPLLSELERHCKNV